MAFGGQDQDQELEQQIRPPTLTTSGSDLSISLLLSLQQLFFNSSQLWKKVLKLLQHSVTSTPGIKSHSKIIFFRQVSSHTIPHHE